MKIVVKLLLLIVLAGGVYFAMRENNSARIKGKILEVADVMQLSPDQRADMRSYINAEHETAYRDALNVSSRVGAQFDETAYFDAVFAAVIDRARQDGNNELADAIEQELPNITFKVKER
jgi:hypothetical protein